MFKSTLAALATLLMFMGSTAFAGGGGGKGNECDPQKVAGSYIALRPALFSGSGFAVLDQLKLGSDGTAYWYQSTAFDLLVSQGSFIPEIGSWKCLRNGTLVVTTIGVNYHTVAAQDIAKDSNHRFTQKLSIVDSNTLQNILRVSRFFLLTDDPLGSNFIGSGSSADPFQYKRVKPITSDVP
jgi:hypothetical protein